MTSMIGYFQVSHVTAVTAELERSYSAGGRGSVGDIKQLLGSVVEKLNILKRKVTFFTFHQ